jgi:NTP pyrophosphatase (non-canonical NTP hydrolase)
MEFKTYQELAQTTAIYPVEAKVYYAALGLAGEVGEICEKVKKNIRDGSVLDKDDLTKELGDVLWYLSALSTDLEISLEDVAITNYEKLKSRQERNVLTGSGDNR